MEGISKSFPGVRALDQVDLEVALGEVHALMGENGAGKSTLMKILAGADVADSGRILIDGQEVSIQSPTQATDLGINIIYQEFNLIPQLSVAENIFLGREPRGAMPALLDRAKMEREASVLVASLGLDIEVTRPVSSLSVALQQMVEIAKAMGRQSRVLVMDEPSATLTDHELDNLYRLIRQLRAKGVSIIYISHRMDEVFSICDRITVLRDGQTVGTLSTSEATPDELIRMMVGRKLEENFPKQAARVGDTVLEVKGLTVQGVLNDISFRVEAGEVVALAGLVGSGRTEVARCIFGADRFDSGEVWIAGERLIAHGPEDAIRAGIGLVSEDRKGEGLILGMGVRENTTLAALQKFAQGGFLKSRAEHEQAEQVTVRLGVRTPSLEQKVRNLSGGNQQKVVLAKWLLTDSKLLILDEPTRGIDVGAKVEIYRLMNQLTAAGMAILMISSELPEVLGMADRILVMHQGKLVGDMRRSEATQEKLGRLAIGGAA